MSNEKQIYIKLHVRQFKRHTGKTRACWLHFFIKEKVLRKKSKPLVSILFRYQYASRERMFYNYDRAQWRETFIV